MPPAATRLSRREPLPLRLQIPASLSKSAFVSDKTPRFGTRWPAVSVWLALGGFTGRPAHTCTRVRHSLSHMPGAMF